MGILKAITKIALAPSVLIGNLVTSGLEKVTGKEYERTTIKEAASTTTGKILGGAIAITGAALVGTAAATGSAATTAIATTATKAAKIIKAAPAPIKTGLATAATIAVLAPQTTKAILKSPEATATAAAAIISPAAGLVVGLEKGTGLLSEAIKTAAPKVGEAIKTAAPYVIGAGVLTAAAVGATQILKDKEVSAELPKEAAITSAQSNKAVEAPVLPETQTITATTGTATRKRKKTRSKALPQQIKQSVGISIINSNSVHRTTKKYINAITLRN